MLEEFDTSAVEDRQERDPFGLDPHQPGAKLDDGKARVWLMLSGFNQTLTQMLQFRYLLGKHQGLTPEDATAKLVWSLLLDPARSDQLVPWVQCLAKASLMSLLRLRTSPVEPDPPNMDHGLAFLQVLAEPLLRVAEITTHGARKYSDNGWKQVPNGEERYLEAALRHLLADLAGEKVDLDSGFPHAAHTAWNLMAALQLRLESKTDADTDSPSTSTGE